MTESAPRSGIVLAPTGEPLPLVVWLDGFPSGTAAELVRLGAYVVAGPAACPRSETGELQWPPTLAAPAVECLDRFGRVYLVRMHLGGRPLQLSAGVIGTPAFDADPWTVALLAGALREAGIDVLVDRSRTGAGASDAQQGVDVRGTEADADALRVAVAALADGLRIAQLKC